MAMSVLICIFATENKLMMQYINGYLQLYNITFAGRLTTETGTFQKNRGYCAMSMLYFGMAWICVLLFLGMPVPRSGAQWVHAFFRSVLIIILANPLNIKIEI